jgi:hypothetical protein
MPYSLKFTCKDGHIILWFGVIFNSINSVPNVKRLAFHATSSSGLTYTHFSEFFLYLDLTSLKNYHFIDFKRMLEIREDGLMLQLTYIRQKILLDEFRRKDKFILAYLHVQYDSSRNAKHGTIVVISAKTKEVIDIVIKTREEAGSAWNIEALTTEEAL